jgi:hypothetical protein
MGSIASQLHYLHLLNYRCLSGGILGRNYFDAVITGQVSDWSQASVKS